MEDNLDVNEVVESGEVTIESTNAGNQQQEQEVKTYTEEEVAKRLQSETDRRINSARTKWEAEYKANLEKEAERIRQEASMSEEEKFQQQLAEERAKFEEERNEFFRAKLETETVEVLAKEGLDVAYKPFVLAENSEQTMENIQALKALISESISAGVKEKINTRKPNTSNTSLGSGMTREDFFKLPYKEQLRLKESDPNVLNKLK